MKKKKKKRWRLACVGGSWNLYTVMQWHTICICLFSAPDICIWCTWCKSGVGVALIWRVFSFLIRDRNVSSVTAVCEFWPFFDSSSSLATSLAFMIGLNWRRVRETVSCLRSYGPSMVSKTFNWTFLNRLVALLRMLEIHNVLSLH